MALFPLWHTHTHSLTVIIWLRVSVIHVITTTLFCHLLRLCGFIIHFSKTFTEKLWSFCGKTNTTDSATFHEKEIWASLWSFRVLTGLFIKIQYITKRLKMLSAFKFICIKYRKYQSCLSLNLMFETCFLQTVTCKVLSKVLFDFFPV